MKKTYLIALVSALAFTANAQTKRTVPAKKITTVKTTTKTIVKPVIVFKNKLDSASYAFGLAMASNLKSGGLDQLNYDLLKQGLSDVFTEKTPLMTEEVSQSAINNIFESFATVRKEREKVREEKEKAKFAPAVKEGETFLAKNKTKPGVTATASGLQYEVLTSGTGNKPKATEQVTVHYKGMLLNGKEFDSSYKRNQPTSFGLNEVIPGWTEGVQLMQEGAKYRFFVPYALAYGARGAGADIPPFSTLIFEVELIKVGGAEK